MSDSLLLYGLAVYPWKSPGKSTGEGCHALLQGNLPNLGIELVSACVSYIAGRFLPTELPGKPLSQLKGNANQNYNTIPLHTH